MQTCAGLHRRETYQCVVPRVTNDECTYGVGGRLGDRCVYKAIERNGNIKKVQSSGLTWPTVRFRGVMVGAGVDLIPGCLYIPKTG